MPASAQPLGFLSLLGGSVLVIAGVTGSTIASVAKGSPDRSKAAGPQPGAGGGGEAPGAPAAGAVPYTKVNTRGLANPLPGFHLGRTDMGVDATAQPGAGIYAIAPGRVLGILPNWYAGQPYLFYEITHGPLAGRVSYVAEQIEPVVKPGQRVRAGQLLARYARTGTGVEAGWATSSGSTLAQSTTGYFEGQVTAAGQDFRHLLESL